MSERSVTLADVGEGLAEAEVVRWLVAEGDAVAADQPIVEIETDKAVIELPAPVAGVVASLTVAAGEVVPIGAELAVIAAAAEDTADNDSGIEIDRVRGHKPVGSRAEGPAAPRSHGDTGSMAPVPDGSGRAGGRVLASPANRRRALEMGLDVATVRGSGPGGRIKADDLTAASRTPAGNENGDSSFATEAVSPPAPLGRPGHQPAPLLPSGAQPDDGPGVVERPLGVRRRAIAETMTRSWQEIPHITELREVDATALVDVRRRLAARLEPEGLRLTVTPLLALVTVAALRRHPDMHATLDLGGGRALLHRRCHLGLAVATDEGLVVPVVANAHRMGIRELARAAAELGGAARAKTLRPEQVQGGTFTITNFGSLGVWLGTPIIRPPEVAIAGFGRIRDQVIAIDGQPVVRPVLPVAVSADHRMVDGDGLARFVTELESLLSDPVLLLAEAR